LYVVKDDLRLLPSEVLFSTCALSYLPAVQLVVAPPVCCHTAAFDSDFKSNTARYDFEFELTVSPAANQNRVAMPSTKPKLELLSQLLAQDLTVDIVS
jgi:hypothetical protein